MQDTQYTFQKKRREFGTQCLFSDKNFLMYSETADAALGKKYIYRNPVSHSTQVNKQMAMSEANTDRAELESHGVNHCEGGWPKDVNYLDPEQTVRYRRKIEKDDSYINQVSQLTRPMEHYIFQNNAVNIYENYFEDLPPAPLIEQSTSRTLNVYRDPCTYKRPVTHLSWSPDNGTKIAVSHCNMTFQDDKTGLSTESYIWEIENPNTPLHVLEPPTSAVCVEYNQKDLNNLASGLYNGQVAAFDVRQGRMPVVISEREVCHREPVNSVLWINSKSGTEFFSGSSDGQVIWWDTRKLNEPVEKLLMDPVKTDDQDITRSYGVSILEYETTIPTRFQVGTEQGVIFSCNRKGKTPTEKIALKLFCHSGPIYSLTRNPAFVKNFLTIGDWVAKIWSEDCRESAVIWTKNHTSMLTDGVWSATKCSLFFISRMDGVVDAWDLLQQQNEPILSTKICDEPIQCLRGHESGRLLGIGSEKGVTYLSEVSETMANIDKNDKALLTAMFDRESKREKILEGKLREIKLKVRTQQKPEEEAEDAVKPKVSPSQAALDAAELEYTTLIATEKKLRNPDDAPAEDKAAKDKGTN